MVVGSAQEGKKVVAIIRIRVERSGEISASLEGGLQGVGITQALRALDAAAARPAEEIPLTRAANEGCELVC
jgi:hypothetical protein